MRRDRLKSGTETVTVLALAVLGMVGIDGLGGFFHPNPLHVPFPCLFPGATRFGRAGNIYYSVFAQSPASRDLLLDKLEVVGIKGSLRN